MKIRLFTFFGLILFLCTPSFAMIYSNRGQAMDAGPAIALAAAQQRYDAEAERQKIASEEQAEQRRENELLIQRKITQLKDDVQAKQIKYDFANENISRLEKSISEEKNEIPENPWRTIDGVAYYLKSHDSKFQSFNAATISTTADGIFVNISGKDCLLENFPLHVADETPIQFMAVKDGVYSFDPVLLSSETKKYKNGETNRDSTTTIMGNSRTINKLNYGIPCERPQNALEVETAAQQLTDSENSQIEAANENATNAMLALETSEKTLQDYLDALTAAQKIRTDAAQQKINESQIKAVAFLQEQATNGSASAQCSLGEHYLKGQGCEMNQSLATYWLMQAANQGDFEASNTLATIKSPVSQIVVK